MGTVFTEVFLLMLTMLLLISAIPLSACGEDETMIIDNGCILPDDDRENCSRYYLVGITNGFGFEEGWNEGSGYGNSKMGWLMNATIYFDIFAYGQVITHGGDTMANQDKYADQTMSHNSILIDGMGQYQYRYWPLSQVGGRYHRVPQQRVGYIAAFDETDDYVYWIGDATNAYETVDYRALR